MKIAPIIAVSLGLVLGSAAHAEDEGLPVAVFTEFIAVAHAEVPGLLRQYAEEDDGALLRGRLRVLTEKGEARLVESSYIVSVSGQRAKLESIREWIYPTEFDPPELPASLTGPIAPGTDLITEANPTSYQMRPVGHSVEFEPTVSEEGTLIALNFAPEIVAFLGNNELFGKDEGQTVQPLFYTTKTQSTLKVTSGTPELFGVFTPADSFEKNAAGTRVLGFVTATSLRPTTAAAGEKEKQLLGRGPEAVRKPEHEGEVDGQVTLLTEYIEVDSALAHALVGKLTSHIDATDLRRSLDTTIKDGGARLLESCVLVTPLGQRAKTESILEYIYPTEFDPAEIPQLLTGPIDAKLRFMTSSGATAFEMRPTGVTVEALPTQRAGSDILDVHIASEMVRRADMLTHGKDAAEAKQPLFESLKLSTKLAMPANTSVLLAMHGLESARAAKAAREPEQAEVRDKRVLVFLTLRLRGPGGGPGKE